MTTRYRYTLQCPRCDKRSETISGDWKFPRVQCGDCLMSAIEIVPMTLVDVSANETEPDGEAA